MILTAIGIGLLFGAIIIYFGRKAIIRLSKGGLSDCCQAEVVSVEASYDSDLEYTGYRCSHCEKNCYKI